MSIVRIQHDKDKPYVQINKIGLETSTVSWAAKGLWAYLISRPDNWRVSVAHLSKIYTGNQRGNGEKAVRAILTELIEEGYVSSEEVREKDGKFKGLNYVVYESRQVRQPKKELKKKVPYRLQGDAVKGALIKNEFIHSSCPEKKLEKSPEKKETIRDSAQARKVSRKSHFLDIPEALDFCEQMGIGIQEKDFKIWRSKFTSSQIYEAMRLILDDQGEMSDDLVLKRPIDNHAAFVNSALCGGWAKERENIELNKKFSKEIKERFQWKALDIKKQYCRCKKTGNDWSFVRNPEDFKREIEEYIEKQRQAYEARKNKNYE